MPIDFSFPEINLNHDRLSINARQQVSSADHFSSRVNIETYHPHVYDSKKTTLIFSVKLFH